MATNDVDVPIEDDVTMEDGQRCRRVDDGTMQDDGGAGCRRSDVLNLGAFAGMTARTFPSS